MDSYKWEPHSGWVVLVNGQYWIPAPPGTLAVIEECERMREIARKQRALIAATHPTPPTA